MGRPKIPGSVSRRGHRWLAQTPPSRGRKGQVFDEEDEAWRWLTEQDARHTLGIGSPEQERGVVLADLIKVWLSNALLKDVTRKDYAIRMEAHVYSHPNGKMLARDVLPLHVDELLSDAPHNWTRIHVAKILSVFWDWAEANGYVSMNAFRRSNAKRITSVAKRVVEKREAVENTWTAEQLIAFIEHEPDPVYRDYWALVAATGARRGESIGITWANVHEDEGWCWLEGNVTCAGNDIIVDDTPKNWKRRKAYFGPVIGRALAVRRSEQTEHRSKCKSWTGEWVFDRRRGWGKGYQPGIHLAPATVTHRFNRHALELSLPPLAGPHGLRRTFATISEAEGFRPSVRGMALGHTPDLLGRYTKVKEHDLRELAERLEQVLLSSVRMNAA